MKLTILHITDLHAKTRITFEEQKIKISSSLVESDQHSNDVLLLFSGDLTFSGAEEQYRVVDSFIKGIEKSIV